MNICIRNQNNEWTSSRIPPTIRDAYVSYKERHHYYQETPHITGEYIVYRIDNDPYLPTYAARTSDIPELENGVGAGLSLGERNNLANNITITREIHERMQSTPIIDMNDISVFIVDNPGMIRSNWLPCREYQAWAYRDFIYDTYRSIKKSYMSPHSLPYSFNDNILANQIVTIPLANIVPNIVFNISRNENNSVYYERNDPRGSRVRICDNEYARAGYLGFYTRITMDPGIVVIPQPMAAGPALYYPTGSGSTAVLSISHISPVEETTDEDNQCILCNRYQINAKFSPCEHKVSCSECYSKLMKNECPVCRSIILRVMNV
jgi:hypothetical protein